MARWRIARLIAILFILTIGMMLLSSCGCESDDDDDDSGDDDSGDDDDASEGLQVRVSALTDSGFKSYAHRNGLWVDETISDGECTCFMYSRSHPDYALAMETVGEYLEPTAIVHFDDGAWEREAIDGDFIYVGIPVFSEQGLGLVIAGTEGPDEDELCHFILSRENGIWSPETVPEISGDWDLIEGPLFDGGGAAFVIGEDYAAEQGFILKRDQGEWTRETLPEIGSEWWYSYNFKDRAYAAPDGSVWVRGYDADHNASFVLTSQAKGWALEEFPEVSDNWAIEQLAFCPDGKVAAAVSEWDLDVGFLLVKDGQWTVEDLPEISGEWRFDEAYCGPDSVPWAIGYQDLGEDYDYFLMSKRTGSWALEDLPVEETPQRLDGLLFLEDGTPVLWGYTGPDIDHAAGFVLMLEDGVWTGQGLSFIDQTYWAFMTFGPVDLIMDSQGELWGGVACPELDQSYIVNYAGGTWHDGMPDTHDFMAWDLLTY